MTLRFTVTGRFDEEAVGSVRVSPEGQPADTYPLAFESKTDDGTATYAAKLPPSSVPFTFRARLQDGRTRGAPGEVRFEARPVVKDVAAWLQLPAVNQAAVGLYRSLGFTEAYRFRFRAR